MKKLIKVLCCLLIFTYIVSLQAQVFADNSIQAIKPFSDVPKSSYAYSAINELRQLGVTDGIGNNRFGYGSLITRGEFVTFLVKLMGWKQVTPAKGSFTDNQDKKKTWYSPVETALINGILSKDVSKFRPSENITREEMAVMIVKSMGYGTLADRLTYLNKPFADVTKNIGYVTIARDTGIVNNKATLFNPSGKALKEQAAVMLINLHNDLIRPLKDLNAFYAISSSSQQDKIPDFSSVCFGWSKLSYNQSSGSIILNSSRNAAGLEYNEYYLPTGFTQRLSAAKESGATAMLMVQSSQDSKIIDPATGEKVGIPEYVLTKPEVYKKLIVDIVSSVKSTTLGSETGSFDGVAIDMEGLKGPKLKLLFNNFLKELKAALDIEDKKLFVVVQPLIHPTRSASCWDGYDYAAIGSIADKVILMAHDYASTKLTPSDMDRGFNITPLTPVEDVYYALEAITDVKNGVQDKSKIMLQISFDWTVWQMKDGKIINSTPASFSLENFIALLNSGTVISYQYSNNYGNPYLKYTDPKSGTENTVWYENTQSVMDKIKLAKLFGIQEISLWRLGTIPDYQPDDGRKLGMDIWQNILLELEKN
jgi:hypothetical protein